MSDGDASQADPGQRLYEHAVAVNDEAWPGTFYFDVDWDELGEAGQAFWRRLALRCSAGS